MTCYSASSHNNSIVVRIASGDTLCLRAYICVSGGHFECRSAREFWNRAASGKTERKAGVVQGQREGAGHMNAISPEAMGSGSPSFLC